jgi:hypothetical protein
MFGLVISFLVWAARPTSYGSAKRILPVYTVGLVVMVLHCGEEYLTGFYRQFPALFGYEWTAGQFLAFNAMWIGIFALAAWGMRCEIAVAYLVAWFFGLSAGIGNGAAHVLLSLWQRRYFPGLFTAPFCLVVGILIVRRLVAASTRA